MTSIGFYIVKENKPDAANILVCRLAAKAYQKKMTMYIYTDSEHRLQKLDEMLWTFKQGSFIPHARLEAHDDLAPIKLGMIEPDITADMLVNLCDEVPKFFSSFPKMAEIVPVSRKPKGRKRYAFYKDRGYVLKTHPV